jgi:hypothetical protein
MARLAPEDLSTFIRLWDGHRAAVRITSTGVQLNAASAVIALTWLVVVNVPASSSLLLRMTAASSILALLMTPLSWIPPERLPSALLVLMPGRYLNFAAFTFVALLVGLLGSRRELWGRLGLLFVTVGLLLTNRSMLWEFLQHHHNVRTAINIRPLRIVWLSALGVVGGGLWTAWKHRVHGPPEGGHSRSVYRSAIPYGATIAVLALIVVMTLHQRSEQSGAHFADRTNDVFFRDVASGHGVLLPAGDLYLIQLRTRRPVLLDAGALDTVMYSLETGASMQRMLREIYGLDLAHPPPDAVGAGRIPAPAHQKTWESYSPDKWRAIRREFGVTQVLAYADWSLQLPVASQSRRLLLYDIPEQ